MPHTGVSVGSPSACCEKPGMIGRQAGGIMRSLRLVAFAIVLAAGQLAAQQPAPPAAPTQAAAAADINETTSVTKHTLDVGGQRVAYTATAGTILLRDDKNKPEASVFYVAYTRDDVTDRARRPIFYSFNGGPGTASVWMHMGFTGPRKVVYDDEGMIPAPPFRLEDNA